MTTDPIELAWFLVALVGTLAGVWNLVDVVLDARAAAGNPKLRPLAHVAIRAEAMRLITITAFLAAGLLAILTQPPETPRVVIVGALILGHVALMLNSVLDRYDRHRLLRDYERELEMGD